MWELRIAHPFGKFSGRNILTCVAAFLVTCLVYIFVAAPTAHAADASWNGDSISYGGQLYTILDKTSPAYSRTLPGEIQYVYLETPLSNVANGVLKAHVIYFANGVDPPKATAANYIVYNFVAPNTYNQGTAAKSISLTPQPPAKALSDTTSCKFEGGLGWIVCPATSTLATAMDTLFQLLTSFLNVRPVQTTQDNALYRAWSAMRNFANVAFVISFLILIYSQLTNVGISNYGIKKMLPRLIIAAILVNVSYWICAIAIDISNIAGYSLQDLLIGIRNSIVDANGKNGWALNSGHVWAEVSAMALAGGVAGTVAVGALLLNPGSIFMLLPMLLGVITAVLVALIVLAARQAIITILVIVAPLAFVAYLLPNTEKYFEKWRELFTTMLVMFPIFSFIFGGSQLAGAAIIQNATDLITIIFGLAVQIAPVVITPLIIRFSGSLLGKIAGMVNNPNKGLIDRTRKWAGERGDQYTSKVMGNRNNKYNDPFSRLGRRLRQGERFREEMKKANDAAADNIFHGSTGKKGYGRIDEINRQLDLDKQIIEHKHEVHWNEKVRDNAKLLEKDLQVRVTADQATAAKGRLDAIHEELKTGNVPLSGTMGQWSQLSIDSQVSAQDIALSALRKQNAEKLQTSKRADALLKNTGTIDGIKLQQYAGGVRGKDGADSALAMAVAEERKAYGQSIAEGQEVLKHFKFNVDQVQDHALGRTVTILDDGHGNSRTFTADDIYTREAAIERQLTAGPVKYANEIVKLSGSELFNFKESISTAVASSKLPGQTGYMGSTAIDQIATGYIDSPEMFTGIIQDAVAKGKFSANKLVELDIDSVLEIVPAVLNPDRSHMNSQHLRDKMDGEVAQLKINIQKTFSDRILNGRLAPNVREQLMQLYYQLPGPGVPNLEDLEN